MKTVLYGFLTAFRPLIFVICKLLTGFGVLTLVARIIGNLIDNTQKIVYYTFHIDRFLRPAAVVRHQSI